jgi:hypothetical protein
MNAEPGKPKACVVETPVAVPPSLNVQSTVSGGSTFTMLAVNVAGVPTTRMSGSTEIVTPGGASPHGPPSAAVVVTAKKTSAASAERFMDRKEL